MSAAYLCDTDAISEVLRAQPLPRFVEWLGRIPREDQFASAVTIGELFHGAYRSTRVEHHLTNIEDCVLPALTTLPYDVAVARVFGKLRARQEAAGAALPDADLQIAATALFHGLELVTGNLRHFSRIEGLVVCPSLDEARRAR